MNIVLVVLLAVATLNCIIAVTMLVQIRDKVDGIAHLLAPVAEEARRLRDDRWKKLTEDI